MSVSQHAESSSDPAILDDLLDIAVRLSPDSPEAKTLLAEYSAQIERLCGNIDVDQTGYLLDFVMILVDGIEQLSCADRELLESECEFLLNVPAVLAGYLKPVSVQHADVQFLELLKDRNWIRPISEDEELLFTSLNTGEQRTYDNDYVELDDLLNNLGSDNHAAGTEAHKVQPVVIDKTKPQEKGGNESGQPNNINSHQQELIDLIKAELMDITTISELPDNDLDAAHLEQYRRSLANLADQAENIGNAVELIGLEGLAQCAKYISRNIHDFSRSNAGLNQRQLNLLKQWPLLFNEYLQNFTDPAPVNELVTLLSNAAWLDVLGSEECENVRYLLENPIFIEDEQVERQSRATDNDVDLTLPDDVNQELLEGLLQDLPTQTEEFSIAIQNIADGGGMDNIDVAQRIAHTLKGAANVVGVKGIANLTHHLEDILQAQAKCKALPGDALVNLLVRASDCLESMAETLLGIDTEPEDAVNVLQDVLDWANSLDNNSAPVEVSHPSVSESEVSGSAAHEKTVPPADEAAAHKDNERPQPQSDISAENVLRVPVSLADDMLRLAGENLIYTSQIHEHIDVISRKQDALELHNQSLQQLSYDLEHLIDIQGFMPGSEAGSNDSVFDPLELDEYHEVHTISRKLVELAADSVELSNELDKDLSGLKELVVNQNQLHKESEELVLRTRMVPIKTIIPRLKRGVRQASRSTEKRVELVVNDNNTYMDSDVLNNLIEPIMHLLRNAIDHGIEHEERRLEHGKPSSGTISLDFYRQGNHIAIDVADDGRGLDADVIYSKALNEGLISENDELGSDNIFRLILRPGFTTRDKVTQVSGRGIGLDVVSVKIRELKGTIDISSDPGEGCRFTLTLPITSFSTHSLLVRSRQYILAISSHGVEEILYPGIGDIRDVGDEIIFHLGQEAYSAILLDDLLDLPPDRRKIERNVRPVLLIREDSGARTAVLVQDVIDSRDIVVKSMGSYMPKLNGIVGATVLGDGSVSPVFDLPEMLHKRSDSQRGLDDESKNSRAAHHVQRLPHVLVVDDSLSARRSLAQFVEDLGYNVRTARDGIEALKIIETSKPDIILVDMEMPKMNGLELTSHVRATPEINHIPIIMITSRSTDKHRTTAIETGVNHYIVKPFDEDELAEHMDSLLENK